MRRHRIRPLVRPATGAFAGFRFPPEVILLAVRWYLRFGLPYRDLEELLAERGIEVDHVTLFRWVQRFTPQLVNAARPCRHAVGDRWFVDETYAKVAGTWRYVYRAIDQHGQVIDVYVSKKRDTTAATKFFTTAIAAHGEPVEVTTDKSPTLAKTIRRGGACGHARHDPVRGQQGRSGPRSPQGQTPSDARPATRPDRQRHHQGSRVHAELASRALRARRPRPP